MWGVSGGFVGGLFGHAFAGFYDGSEVETGFWLGILPGLIVGAIKIFGSGRSTDPLAEAVAPMLEGGRASGAQAAGNHRGQAVRFWTDRGTRAGEVQVNCSVRVARGDTCLESVDAHDLDIERFAGPGEIAIRPGGVRAVWTSAQAPNLDAARGWVRAIFAEADARRVAEGHRIDRLIELVEDGRPSAFGALVAEEPEHPRLAELAGGLTHRPEPAARFVGARWLGAEALEALVDDLTYEPVWQAKALRARAEAADLPADAIQRWAGVPGLHLELLIDQMRRGPIGAVAGLTDAAPTWTGSDDERLLALADAIIERGPEVEPAARRLFEAQPVGRRHLARALGGIGDMPSLMTLRAARAALDWPQFDEDEAAVDRAIAQITHRVGDAATGMLALDQHEGEAGGLAVVRQGERA